MDIELPQHIKVLLQEVLLIYFMFYFLGMQEAKKDELRSAVFLEEFQNMLPKSSIEKETGGEILENLFREGRKFGLGLIAIMQSLSEASNYVLGNCRSQVHYAAQTEKDIRAVSNSLFLENYKVLDHMWRGEAIAKIKGRVKNCLILTEDSPVKGIVSDVQLKEMMKRWEKKN